MSDWVGKFTVTLLWFFHSLVLPIESIPDAHLFQRRLIDQSFTEQGLIQINTYLLCILALQINVIGYDQAIFIDCVSLCTLIVLNGKCRRHLVFTKIATFSSLSWKLGLVLPKLVCFRLILLIRVIHDYHHHCWDSCLGIDSTIGRTWNFFILCLLLLTVLDRLLESAWWLDNFFRCRLLRENIWVLLFEIAVWLHHRTLFAHNIDQSLSSLEIFFSW